MLGNIIVLCLAACFFGGVIWLSYRSRDELPPSQPIENQVRLDVPSEGKRSAVEQPLTRVKKKHSRKGPGREYSRKTS